MTEKDADDESTVFHLQLNCTARKSLDNKTLRPSSFPSSTLELKEAIEAKFSIPVCVQSLSYQLAPLSDSDDLAERRIRSGDTLSVSYLCEGDCELIRLVIEWFCQVTAAIQVEHLSEGGGAHTDSIIKNGVEADYSTLLNRCFMWLDAKGYVNKLYFEKMGGLQTVIELYREMTSREWNCEMPPTFKFLECFAVHATADFGETLELRRHILKHEGVLSMVLKSLLRKRVLRGEYLEDSGDSEEVRLYNSETLKELIRNAAHAVCK